MEIKTDFEKGYSKAVNEIARGISRPNVGPGRSDEFKLGYKARWAEHR